MTFIAIDTAVQGAIVTTAGTVMVALVGVVAELQRRQSRAINEVREHAAEAREQVANTHSTNLRDDLDKVIAGLDLVLAGQARHEDALREIRGDLAHERSERLAVEQRLDTHIAVTVDR